MTHKTTVYSSRAIVRFKSSNIPHLVENLGKAAYLGWRLSIRDISARYRQSFLGFFWAVIPPLASAAVFIFLQKSGAIKFKSGQIPYPAFVLSGTILWQLFVESFRSPMKAINSNKAMIKKINFPKEALLISSFIQLFFDFILKIGVAILLLYFVLSISFSSSFYLAPIYFILISLLGLTLGLLITPFSMLFPDLNTALPYLTNFWFFITPVIYSPPEGKIYVTLNKINLVAPLINSARDVLFLGIPEQIGMTILAGIFTFFLFILSWIFVKISLPILTERMGA